MTRCATNVTIKRADEIQPRDQVILTDWRGTPYIERVTIFRIVGDDVTLNDHLTTSAGNEFHVVTVS